MTDPVTDDYTMLVTGLLGIDPAHLGAVLLWLVSISTVAGLVTPWLQARLPEWSASARATATLHDDRAVRVLGHIVSALVTLVALTAWIVPRFALGLRAGREARALESRR